MSNVEIDDVGVVVIGRNEGERLRHCLTSIANTGRPIVYVDSGSTDGSEELARQMNVEVISLAKSEGFTAARARNAGFDRLVLLEKGIQFVQFVDGDCVVDSSWLLAARSTFAALQKCAVACGRRRERFAEASIYNRLCDLEWNTPIGEATECGGDSMMRVNAFRAVGGFNGGLIAGEEPELCVRLRAGGWTIQRIDAEMTLHDAAMTRFGQWWNRNVRAGHAFAEGSSLHGKSPLKHWVRQTQSNWLWGFIVPMLAVSFAWPTRGISILAWLVVAGLMICRVFLNGVRRRQTVRDAALIAPFTIVGKVPQAIGQIRFMTSRWLGHRAGIIEYKATTPGIVSN